MQMRVRPHAPGTGAYSLDSIWCRRVPRQRYSKATVVLVAEKLRAALVGAPRPMRPSVAIAPGVRRRAA